MCRGLSFCHPAVLPLLCCRPPCVVGPPILRSRPPPSPPRVAGLSYYTTGHPSAPPTADPLLLCFGPSPPLPYCGPPLLLAPWAWRSAVCQTLTLGPLGREHSPKRFSKRAEYAQSTGLPLTPLGRPLVAWWGAPYRAGR